MYVYKWLWACFYISCCFSFIWTLEAFYSKIFLSFPYLQPRLPYYVSLYVLTPSLLHLSLHFFFPHRPLCLSCLVPDYCFDSHCPVELEFSCFSVCSVLDCVIVGVVKRELTNVNKRIRNLFPGVTYLPQVKHLPLVSLAAHCRHLQNAYSIWRSFSFLSVFILFQFINSHVLFVIKVPTLNKAHSKPPNNKMVYQQAISIHLKVKEKRRRGKSSICKERTEKDRTGGWVTG